MIIHTWRNIFFFEGLITILTGLGAPFLMPTTPAECWFLNERERKIAFERLRMKNGAEENERVQAHHITRSIFNINNYICAFGFFFINITVQGISLFMVSLTRNRRTPKLTFSVAYYSQGSRLDSDQGSVVYCPTLRLRLRRGHCRCVPLRQSESSWYLPRGVYLPRYFRLCDPAMGD